jgi:hypothetical protein
MNQLLMPSLNSSDYIALASAVVALCALGTSIWQGFLSRRHNILSVRPHIEIVLRAKDDPVFAIDLINNGLGPAFIAKLSMRRGSSNYELESEHTFDIFTDALAGSNNFESVEYYVPNANSSIGPGCTVRILTIHPNKENPTAYEGGEAFKEVARELNSLITYSCIYGKKYTSYYAAQPIKQMK